MPELPEVETILRSLAPAITGRRVAAVEVRAPRLRRPIPGEAMQERLVGRRISGLERRAKYLLWHLDDGGALILHLGMSGRLSFWPEPVPPEPHTHLIFHFDPAAQLHFRDPRRFGSIDLVRPGELAGMASLAGLGLEPLSAEFTPARLQHFLTASRRPVKSLIMDQAVVVGVGNIYANEALFLAGIHPLRPSSSLTTAESAALHAAIVATLARAVERGGTTLNDYRDSAGEPGFFQLDLAVYGRQQEPCPRCGREIIRLVQGGRSSFLCEACQL